MSIRRRISISRLGITTMTKAPPPVTFRLQVFVSFPASFNTLQGEQDVADEEDAHKDGQTSNW